jgi:hypothetical protein
LRQLIGSNDSVGARGVHIVMLSVGAAGFLFVCCREASEESEVIDERPDRTPPEPLVLEKVGGIAEPTTPNACREQLEWF